ncbi:hypothetical protein [Haloarcula argentinensis]|uniref:Uncharacterized protein n=1 Tax=Haloarcula argentinensis TaxID=43776 RepID=A0ABU2F659_HALAR|nr:hypothetical protein [Haloarcula argentinensis]MDS0256068.1 hypothetical protein [Haloarcula argentinensis]
MSSYRPVASKRQQSDFSERFAEDFDTAPLHNTVWTEIDEDAQLARFCDGAAAAEAAAEHREDRQGYDALAEKADKGWGRLRKAARERALEVVAEACATVIQDGDQWVNEGHWEQEVIDAAKREARDWLQCHTNEADRVGVLEVLADD